MRQAFLFQKEEIGKKKEKKNTLSPKPYMGQRSHLWTHVGESWALKALGGPFCIALLAALLGLESPACPSLGLGSLPKGFDGHCPSGISWQWPLPILSPLLWKAPSFQA